VETFSSLPYSVDTIPALALPPEGAEQVMNAAPGSIVGPFVSYQGYKLYHVLGSVPANTQQIRASHILINQFGDDAKNYEEAMQIYKELQNGADFAATAEKYSRDLGWFGKGRMVPEFEKAAFSAKIGVVQKPIKTNYGYHIIKVTGISNKDYVVEQIVSPIKASSTTKDQVLNNAKDFSYIANKDDFEKEAKLMKYKILTTPAFSKDMNFIPGLGANPNLMDFAFNNSLNTISDAIRTQSGYVVAKVSEIIKEGHKPLNDFKDQVKNSVIREKKFELAKKEAENIKSKINGDLSKVSTIDPRVTLNQTGDFTPSGPIPGIGMDYNVTANSLKMPLNIISDPVKGNNGYYLIKVLSRSPFNDSAYSAQRNAIRDEILQQERNTILQEWMNKLKKDADIVDNRTQFFGQ
jgi:parvulin-like peptidyl-prolyl isomerase